MMFTVRNDSLDPYENLAREEYLLKHREKGDYLLLWRNRPSVIIGRNQVAGEEVRMTYARAHGIPVVRRMSGGGAVYHDSGNVNYSVITDWTEGEAASIRRFLLPVVKALCGLGIRAEISGRNDILADGKKVSGNAQAVYGNRILHHGTLLFRADLEAAAAVLAPSAEKFEAKSTRSVRSRIGNLWDLLPSARKMDVEAFQEYLYRELAAGGMKELPLSKEEEAAVCQLRDEKYASRAWNEAEAPDYTFRNRKRFAGGTLEVRCRVSEGVLKEI